MRRSVALFRGRNALLSSRGLKLVEVTDLKSILPGPGEVLLEMKASVIGIEDT